MSRDPHPRELELLVKRDEATDYRRVPLEALGAYYESAKDGTPSAIVKHSTGWYVICSAGQGPMIVWREKPPQPRSIFNLYFTKEELLGGPITGSHTRRSGLDRLKRGQVWCFRCGNTMMVKPAECLDSGWPECCDETMSIDSPEERVYHDKTTYYEMAYWTLQNFADQIGDALDLNGDEVERLRRVMKCNLEKK
jgi:hypothetical protein